MWSFPQTRWAFSHIRELLPTAEIRRAGSVAELPRAERPDLDSLSFTTMDGRTMSWRESLEANFTDGIVVLHRGRVVYEKYFGALRPDGQHIAMSVTKSFVGALVECLIAEGTLEPTRTLGSYVPELARSGFGNATVRHVLDMRTSLQYVEDYADIAAGTTDTSRMLVAAGWIRPPAGVQVPAGNYRFVANVAANGTHGGDFSYLTPNSSALGWLLERVTGQSLADQLHARFWSTMGMEQDASLTVDRVGTGFAGAGLTTSLRDLARFGEMIRRGGRWNGRQIMPESAVASIVKGGDPAAFAKAGYPGLEGGNYGSQWWHRVDGQVLALGIHGQGIYIDPAAELVIARFASHPTASNRGINPVTIPAYDAVARWLTGRSR
jgi:CubicO group peptidase (beta-lactamase class C family)